MSRALRLLRRWPIVVGIVVLVAGGGSAAWALSRSSGGDATTQLATATIRTVTQTVAASGTIAPLHEADLDFGASGRVATVEVKVGDHVHAGDVLARIGTATLSAQHAAAEASVSAAEAQVADDDSASNAAALQAARSQLRNAEQALQAAKLTATIGGTVTDVNLTVGQQVTAGAAASNAASNSSGSSSQVVVQSTKSFLVNATVDDTQVGQVKKGQHVTVTPDGDVQSPVTGTVRTVSKVPTSSSGVVSFPVVVRVHGHPVGVYAGAGATLSIVTKRVPNVLEIPALAVHYNGSTATVEVQDGSSTRTRTVTIGQTYGAQVQVLSGLRAGEKVVVTLPQLPSIVRNGGSGKNGRFQIPSGLFNRGGGGFPSGGFPSGGFTFNGGNG